MAVLSPGRVAVHRNDHLAGHSPVEPPAGRYLQYHRPVPEMGMAQKLMAAGKLPEHRGHETRRAQLRRTKLGLFSSRSRSHIAIAIRADGRLVQVPSDDLGLVDVSLLGLLRSLEFGIGRVFGLITGSRREAGRRDRR